MPGFTAPAASHLKAAAWDPSTHRLHVTFKSGGAYDYKDVSAQRFNAFAKADSKGKYLAHRIEPNYSGMRSAT